MGSNAKSKIDNWQFNEERLDDAMIALSMSVQFALQKAMNEGGLTHKDLAERLGVSPARVSQYFSKDASNLTLKTVARIADALGDEFELMSLKDLNAMRENAFLKKNSLNALCTLVQIEKYRSRTRWVDWSAANEQTGAEEAFGRLRVAAG